MTTTFKIRAALLSASALAGLGVGAPAFAQTQLTAPDAAPGSASNPDAAAASSDDIVVTATRRNTHWPTFRSTLRQWVPRRLRSSGSMTSATWPISPLA